MGVCGGERAARPHEARGTRAAGPVPTSRHPTAPYDPGLQMRDAIKGAADAVLRGEYDEHFPLSVFQTGAARA